jgi:hypothetical protein
VSLSIMVALVVEVFGRLIRWLTPLTAPLWRLVL